MIAPRLIIRNSRHHKNHAWATQKNGTSHHYALDLQRRGQCGKEPSRRGNDAHDECSATTRAYADAIVGVARLKQHVQNCCQTIPPFPVSWTGRELRPLRVGPGYQNSHLPCKSISQTNQSLTGLVQQMIESLHLTSLTTHTILSITMHAFLRVEWTSIRANTIMDTNDR
jgi:hypothetical protein